ncbi:TIM barrel protein [Marimonas sp. MJW-29]|uniref:TIM barrel protein n=1 Tax=Sulfitobacter sediminis TaxID=3234186 RepID=A0ABV3RQX8_9RHOB
MPGREGDARAAIDQALGYARAIGAGAVHVMAGLTSGAEAERTFAANLRYAYRQAGEITILIEPQNRHDAPGYFRSTTDQARRIIERVGQPNLKATMSGGRKATLSPGSRR